MQLSYMWHISRVSFGGGTFLLTRIFPPPPPLGFVNNKIAQNLGNTILLHHLALLRFLLGGRLYSIS